MGGRSLILFGILLLCAFAGSCSKRSIETSDEIITEGFDIHIDEEGLNEKMDMTDNKKLQVDDSMVINSLEEKDSSMTANKTEATEEIEVTEEIEATDATEVTEETDETIAFTDQYKSLAAGSVLDITGFSQEILDSLFNIEELNLDVIDRIIGKSYKEDADIPYSDLRYIRLLYIGFDGLSYAGEMIVNKAIAEDVIEIFKELYEIEYPIEKILLIDEYDADDLKSMADNNSSSFNYRFVEGTNRRSVHSDGLAIDINPLYNPYVRTRDGILEIFPENGAEYVDRDMDNKYYIRKDDPCYKAFVSRGFTWGGEWMNSKDYQHFEKKLAD